MSGFINVWFLGLLSVLVLFSCAKSDEVPEDEKVDTEDTDNPEKDSDNVASESTYTFTVSGALEGEKSGIPSVIVSNDPGGDKSRRGLSTMKFSSDEKGNSTEHHLLVTFNNEQYKTSPLGLPFEDIDNAVEWVGDYPIYNDRNKFSDEEPSFSITYYDRQPNKKERIFGGKAKTEGEFKILKSANGSFSGTFEFEAFEQGGPDDSKILVVGSWEIK